MVTENQKEIPYCSPSTSFGTFRNRNVGNQEPTEDRSQDDPHPKVGPFVYQSRHSTDSDPDEAPHMVTGVQERNRYRPYSVAGFRDDIPYCSLGTSSGKQKKARSTSPPQFRTENTPATIEADQILSALQQLATNSNSVNFTKTSVESRNCVTPLQRQSPHLMEDQKSSNLLKIYSKQV